MQVKDFSIFLWKLKRETLIKNILTSKIKKTVFYILMLGFIPVLVIADENRIKPGIIITQKNYKNYLPDLKKLLSAGGYDSVVNGVENVRINIPVVKKINYPIPLKYGEATKKYSNRCSAGKRNELIGWVSGLPFPEPKNGLELAWNIQRRDQITDQMSFYTEFLLFDSSGRKTGKIERSIRAHLYNRYYIGRHTIPPIPEEPGNNGLIRLKESMVVIKPFDVKGFSMIRICYDPLDKTDDCFSYIPAIRRLRRLTGSDVTDPVLGCDFCYDDFETIRQKINSKMTFNLLGTKDLLVPIHYTKIPSNHIQADCYQWEWEIRPSWILQYNINDPGYAYSKRVIYVEKELPTADLYGADNYDLKGRLWRTSSMIAHAKDAKTFDANCWYGAKWIDHISGHTTLQPMWPTFADPMATKHAFTIRHLLQEAR